MIGVHLSIQDGSPSRRSGMQRRLLLAAVALLAFGPVMTVAADEKAAEGKVAAGRGAERRWGDRRGPRGRRDEFLSGHSLCDRHGRRDRDQVCETCREHWDALDPEKREKIRELHARLRVLDPRGELRRRLGEADPEDVRRALANLKKVSDLPPDQRKREIRRFHSHLADEHRWRLLSSRLPQERRREIEREIADLPAPDRGRRIRAVCDQYLDEVINNEANRRRREAAISALPPYLQARVSGMKPLEQVRFLLGRQSQELFEKVFDDLETRKAVLASPWQLRGLVRLDGAPRPASFNEASWKRWKELKREERERLVRYVYRYDRCKHGRAPGGWRSRDRSGASWRGSRERPQRGKDGSGSVRPGSPVEKES